MRRLLALLVGNTNRRGIVTLAEFTPKLQPLCLMAL